MSITALTLSFDSITKITAIGYLWHSLVVVVGVIVKQFFSGIVLWLW
jgi:hypothetical protein